MTDLAAIVATIRHRQADRHPLIAQMAEVRTRYNGDYVIPLNLEDSEVVLPPIAASLISEAIDVPALRAASIMPNVVCPAVDPTIETGPRSREFAAIRERAYEATLREIGFGLHLRRLFRQLAGYATCSGVVLADDAEGRPTIEVRDPLATLPSPRPPEDVRPPDDCAFVYQRSASWLRARFPLARRELGGPVDEPTEANELWETFEWIDADEIVLGLAGPLDPAQSSARHLTNLVDSRVPGSAAHGDGAQMVLRRWPNRAGRCTAFIPHTIGLDRIQSHVANGVGQVDVLARLMALDVIATEKAIWPDRYAIGRPGGQPRIVGGEWADGRTGKINLLADVEQIGELRGAPDPNNKITQDRVERNFRVSQGQSAVSSGENANALRTGRGIDTLLGASIDPRVQELHEIMEHTLPHVNRLVADIYKGHWGRRSFSMFTGRAGDDSHVTFTPNRHFGESTHNAVSYPIPGADVSQTTVILGQLLRTKGVSLHTFRIKHPWVDAPETEARRINEETLEEALTQGIANRIASPEGMPLEFAALIEEKVRRGADIYQAVTEADTEIRERQAAVAPEPPPEGGVPPELAPGLDAAGPGAANPAGPPPAGPPPGAAPDLGALIGALTSGGGARP